MPSLLSRPNAIRVSSEPGLSIESCELIVLAEMAENMKVPEDDSTAGDDSVLYIVLQTFARSWWRTSSPIMHEKESKGKEA